MKLIAHRANIDGPDESTANEPKQIDKCIEQGYDVEIDVRYDPKTERLWLGHDEPKYACLLYTSPSPRDQRGSRMPSSA